jgi:hypothetical protein
MARQISRIGASAVGTNAQLTASTLKLEPGERWFRTDAPNVTDSEHPFYNLPNPSLQWKTGTGDPANSATWKLYSELLFDPIGLGTGGSGGDIELNPMTVFANPSGVAALGTSLPILPLVEDPDEANLRDLLGALTADDLNPVYLAIGDVSDVEAAGGGLRNIIDSFIGITPAPVRTVTATFTAGSPTVTVSSPLPAEIAQFSHVTGPAAQIPNNGFQYVGAVASDRMSFTLSSTAFSLAVPPVSTPVNAAGPGTVSIKILNPWNAVVFGLYLTHILQSNPATGDYTWRNHGNALSGGASTSLDVSTRVKDGHLYHKSAATTGAGWEQQTGGVETTIPVSRVVAAIAPQTVHNWTTQPAALTEFLEEDGTTIPFRHRFDLWVPDDYYTQFQIWVDTLIIAGSTSSKLFIEWWNGSAWVDPTTTRVEAPLTGTLDEGKRSPWGTLSTAFMAAIVASTDRYVRARIVGNSSNGTGNPQFGNVGYSIR